MFITSVFCDLISLRGKMRAETKESRINLNDLLKKAEERKKQENKTNLLIISLIAGAVIVVLGVLSK